MLNAAPTFTERGTLGRKMVLHWLHSIQSKQANALLLVEASLAGNSALHQAMWRGAAAIEACAAENMQYLRQCGGLLFLGRVDVQEMPGGEYAVRTRAAA